MKYKLSHISDSGGSMGTPRNEGEDLKFWQGYVSGWLQDRTIKWKQIGVEWWGYIEGDVVAIIKPVESGDND